MKKFSQVGSCCITVGLQFPPEVEEPRVGYTLTMGSGVLMGQFFGEETLKQLFATLAPKLTPDHKLDMALAIQNMFSHH
jgi:hypothetical protein